MGLGRDRQDQAAQTDDENKDQGDQVGVGVSDRSQGGNVEPAQLHTTGVEHRW